MTIALTRHGETNWNAERRLQGSTDIPLNDIGREQAVVSAARFDREHWHLVVTSPLSRASETGAIIAAGLGIRVGGVYADLAERDYGRAEGLTDADAIARWADGAYPGLEDRNLVAARGLRAIDRIASDLPDASVIVVAHGTLIREVLGRLTSTPIPPILNATTSIIELADGEWSVCTVNELLLASSASPVNQ